MTMTEDVRTEGQVGRHGGMTAVVNGPEGDGLDWQQVDWAKVEDEVRRLRQRIFTASKAGDLKRVRSLQKLMLRSRANALLSVRRVTEVNTGRKTAGVDGKVVVTAPGKAALADRVRRLGLTGIAQPVKRVYIPEGERETAPARHPRDLRPCPPSTGEERVGARVGGTVRAEVLRVSAGPWLP